MQDSTLRVHAILLCTLRYDRAHVRVLQSSRQEQHHTGGWLQPVGCYAMLR